MFPLGSFKLDSHTFFTPARLARAPGSLKNLPNLDRVPLPAGVQVRDEMVDTPAGRIGTLRLLRPNPGPLILFLGGNNFFIARSAGFVARRLCGLGDLLFCDHSGYGRSEGEAEPAAMLAGALGVAAHARDIATSERRPLVVWGASIGGFLAAHCAAAQGADAVVLEAVAPSAERWAGSMAARRGLADFDLEPAMVELARLSALKGYRGKVLLLAGRNDPILPVELTRETHQWCLQHGLETEYHELSNDAHNLKPLGATLDVAGEFLVRHAILDPAARLDPDGFEARSGDPVVPARTGMVRGAG